MLGPIGLGAETGGRGGAMTLLMPPTAPFPPACATGEAKGGSCINERGGCCGAGPWTGPKLFAPGACLCCSRASAASCAALWLFPSCRGCCFMLSDDAVRARKVRIRGIEQDTGFPDVYITPRSKCRLVGRIYVEAGGQKD